jgi:hypothetical protein
VYGIDAKSKPSLGLVKTQPWLDHKFIRLPLGEVNQNNESLFFLGGLLFLHVIKSHWVIKTREKAPIS